MTVEDFFDLFLKELKDTDIYDDYYKFHQDESRLAFRKAYFVQRLQYIMDHMPEDRNISILDLGCGYGTTAIFLCLNGYQVEGITLEFYYKVIESRLQYWQEYGDVTGFTYHYRDIFDGIGISTYDVVIAQDTLHHLEPLGDALKMIEQSLKPSGKLISIEENGANIIQNLKLIKQRGFKKVKTIYDETLKKEILLGDENIRSISTWRKELAKSGLSIMEDSINYIRYSLPHQYGTIPLEDIIEQEQKIQQSNKFKRTFFFFGLNFIAQK